MKNINGCHSVVRSPWKITPDTQYDVFMGIMSQLFSNNVNNKLKFILFNFIGNYDSLDHPYWLLSGRIKPIWQDFEVYIDSHSIQNSKLYCIFNKL